MLIVIGCLNCEDKSHVTGDSPKSLNLLRVAQRKLDYICKKRFVIVCFELRKMESKTVVHAVDKSTLLKVVRYLDLESTAAIWFAFDVMWPRCYLNPSDTEICD